MSARSPDPSSLSRQSEPSRARKRSKPAARGALAPGLYIVATPIGNLADISLRAIEVLATADLVACEDTRTTRRLLGAHGIAARLTAYHDHNATRMRPKIMARLERGETVALVSDAGTPLISDPGYKLVAAAAEAGVTVTAVPGASAGLAALTISGLPSDRYFFAGFLPNKSAARRRALAELTPIPASLVIYESARRLPASLADMAAVLGPRPAAVARELTKLHEEVRRATLPALAEHYAAAGPPKGEVVVVIGPPDPDAAAAPDAETVDIQLRAALRHDSLRDAVAAVAEATGLPRKRVYARALELAQEASDDS